MKEQIKELRVQIDGLHQLTKELKPEITQVDLNLKRKDETIDEFCVRAKIENLGTRISQTSKEIEDATHSLIYAKAWLGKMLGELGEENPYKSGYKTVADIEPTADKCEVLCTTGLEGIATNQTWKEKNHIEKVDWLRTEIEKVVNEVKQIGNAPNPPMLNRELSIARTNAYNHLCEARFALGFELERIKEENK
jgi:uncharacterized coiled-coil DUF342 family protein